jgi:hypothetical protein
MVFPKETIMANVKSFARARAQEQSDSLRQPAERTLQVSHEGPPQATPPAQALDSSTSQAGALQFGDHNGECNILLWPSPRRSANPRRPAANSTPERNRQPLAIEHARPKAPPSGAHQRAHATLPHRRPPKESKFRRQAARTARACQ